MKLTNDGHDSFFLGQTRSNGVDEIILQMQECSAVVCIFLKFIRDRTEETFHTLPPQFVIL